MRIVFVSQTYQVSEIWSGRVCSLSCLEMNLRMILWSSSGVILLPRRLSSPQSYPRSLRSRKTKRRLNKFASWDKRLISISRILGELESNRFNPRATIFSYLIHLILRLRKFWVLTFCFWWFDQLIYTCIFWVILRQIDVRDISSILWPSTQIVTKRYSASLKSISHLNCLKSRSKS